MQTSTHVYLFYDVLASIGIHFVYSVVSQNSGKHRNHPWTPGRYHEVSESWVPYWKLDGEMGMIGFCRRCRLVRQWSWWFVFGTFTYFVSGNVIIFACGLRYLVLCIVSIDMICVHTCAIQNFPFLWLADTTVGLFKIWWQILTGAWKSSVFCSSGYWLVLSSASMARSCGTA